MSATTDLKHLVEWWSVEHFKNELHEDDTRPLEIKNVYCQIIPKSGKTGQIQAVNPIVNNVEVTHVFKCRYYSCPTIKITDWFIYKGKKYEVVDFQEDFKDRQFMWITTKIVYE